MPVFVLTAAPSSTLAKVFGLAVESDQLLSCSDDSRDPEHGVGLCNLQESQRSFAVGVSANIF